MPEENATSSPLHPARKVADVFRRSRNIAGESAVIIVTEINGTLYAQIIQAERVRNLGQDSRGVTTVASASGVTQPETAHEDLTIGLFRVECGWRHLGLLR